MDEFNGDQTQINCKMAQSFWSQINFMSHQNDNPQVKISVTGVLVKSKDYMNILGKMFDSKFTWAKHVKIQTSKASSALRAVKLIQKYFNQSEI